HRHGAPFLVQCPEDDAPSVRRVDLANRLRPGSWEGTLMAAVARTRERFNWPLFLVLWAGALAGILASIPYLLWLLGHNPKLPRLPLSLFIANQLLANGLLIGFVSALGLRCATPLHLGAPIIADALAGRSVGSRMRAIMGPAVLIGAAVAIVLT